MVDKWQDSTEHAVFSSLKMCCFLYKKIEKNLAERLTCFKAMLYCDLLVVPDSCRILDDVDLIFETA